MGKIIVLDELTASQIAAGEVIERPASVVKETVENSVDAGADSITVEIRGGGVRYIRITDNGSGFERDDAVIAFDKHATSKIRNGSDLAEIHTLGFRGEALASIASVADVELLSRTADAEKGIYVHIKGGNLIEQAERSCAKGTSITVKDLFFNVPARYKFLKKDQTEAGYVAEIMQTMALAHPDISFRLVSNGLEIMRTPGGNLENAVYSIFGAACLKDLVSVSYTDGENTVKGFAGVRSNIYGTRSRQIFFVNGRPVKSRLVSSAVDEAYTTVTMKHRFPMCILNISVPVTRLDVNVHPAKTEVRFASESSVYTSVLRALRNALFTENRVPSASDGDNAAKSPQTGVSTVEKPVENTGYLWKSPDFSDKSMGENVKLPIFEGKKENNSGIVTADSPKPSYTADTPAPYTAKKEEIIAEKSPVKPAKDPDGDNAVLPDVSVKEDAAAAAPVTIISDARVVNALPEQLTGTYNETDVYTESRVIGQFLKTYILLEKDGELIIIDQHAAHERIKYEAICEYMDRADADPLIAPMLLPSYVRLSPSEYMLYEQAKQYFEEIGFEIDDFGQNTLAVRAVPAVLSEADPEDLILTGIAAVTSPKGKGREGFRTEAVYTMACKAAVKANRELSAAEIKGLLESLAKLDNSATCPHGRPIVVKISSHELEKRFKRCL